MDLTQFNNLIRRWGIDSFKLKPDQLGTGSALQVVRRNSTNTGLEYATVSGGGGATWTEAEIDFGTTPRYEANFTITDASASATSKIAISESGKTATGRADGDSQWDSITLTALPASGSFTAYAVATPGPVVGKRKVQYSINS